MEEFYVVPAVESTLLTFCCSIKCVPPSIQCAFAVGL